MINHYSHSHCICLLLLQLQSSLNSLHSLMPSADDLAAQSSRREQEWNEWRTKKETQLSKQLHEYERAEKLKIEESLGVDKKSQQELSYYCDCIAYEVTCLHAILSAHKENIEPNIKYLVGQYNRTQADIYDSLPSSIQVINQCLHKYMIQLKSIRNFIADQYANNIGQQCVTQ